MQSQGHIWAQCPCVIRKGARAPPSKASRAGALTELDRAAELMEPREFSGHNVQIDVLFANHVSSMMHSLPGHGCALFPHGIYQAPIKFSPRIK